MVGWRWLASLAGSIATALAASAALGAPIVTTVDRAGGSYSSIALNAGRPVVSYFDDSTGHLKLATCTAGCDGRSPTWVVSTVDATGVVGWYTSLQLDAGKPVVAYYDVTRGALKFARCVSGCETASPSWTFSTVDSSSVDTGRFPSMELDQGRPVIAYRDRTRGQLRLATCVDACANPEPTWAISVVDRDGDAGRFASMKLNAGAPVIGYLDVNDGLVKVATCISGCRGATPSWAISIVGSSLLQDESKFSLQLDGDKPLLTYYDAGSKHLKLATCTAACNTAQAAWTVVTVDAFDGTGIYSSLQLRQGAPFIAYHAGLASCTYIDPHNGVCHVANDLRLASCLAGCATASPTWAITTIDNDGTEGWDPALVVEGNRAFASYLDVERDDLKVAFIDLAQAARPPNHTGMWWDPLESGWGLALSHQGDVVFASVFTYDAAGQPTWFFMPASDRRPDDSFAGALYRATGPAFDARPFTPLTASNLTAVGSLSLTFVGDTARLSYDVNGAAVSKTVKKYLFGTPASDCGPASGDRKAATNFQDLWWNPQESGWGLQLTHQGDLLFATLYTFDASGRAWWLMAPAVARQPDGSFAGDLFRTTGPAFNSVPFTPITNANVVRVGTLQLRFSDGENAVLSYSVDGTPVSKAISRYVMALPATVCASGP